MTIKDDLIGCQQIIKLPIKTFGPCCDLVATLVDTIHPTCESPLGSATVLVTGTNNPTTITHRQRSMSASMTESFWISGCQDREGNIWLLWWTKINQIKD